MGIKKNELDDIWNIIKKTGVSNEMLIKDMKKNLSNGGIEFSILNILFSSISSLLNGNKMLRILDYGSGGGRLVFYLRLMGYKNSYGVDLYSNEELDKVNLMSSNIGIDSEPIFYAYDGKTLPFDSSSFDLIISQQVVEHVHNLECYYSECNRILNSQGKLLLEFPHRLIPFDSHTKMWFIHYFPRNIRNFFYNKYRTNEKMLASDYYDDLLNLKSKAFHKRILKKYFSKVNDQTSKRIRSFDRERYEGNIRVRRLAHLLINIPLLGPMIAKCISVFGTATFIAKK
jgi:SAM-dependent methyltransferase